MPTNDEDDIYDAVRHFRESHYKPQNINNMKISQKQANLLAKEIIKRLQYKKAEKISEELRTNLQKWDAKRKQLSQKKQDIADEMNAHERTLGQVIGKNIRGIYTGERLSAIIEKIEAVNIPTVSEIEDEIILKSMFADEADMNKFVNDIVSKYDRKRQSKIVQN